MGYEVRVFQSQQGLLKDEGFSKSFEDVYIYKKGVTKVGIKLRKPKKTEDGWKVESVEVKQRVEQQENGSIIQKWVKEVYDFAFKINLKYIQAFNQELCFYLGINVENKSEQLKKWLSQQISEIYSITKTKNKHAKGQRGQVSLIPTLNSLNIKQNVLYFSTSSYEGQRDTVVKAAQQHSIKFNISYPDLLELVFGNQLQIIDKYNP